MRCLCVSLVALLAACDISFVQNQDASIDGGGGALACNGQQIVCPSVPYGVCVEIQQGGGHCVDWRSVGASPCMNGPAECPASLPTGNFATGSAGMAVALCIKESVAELASSTPTAGSGYCAAEQSAQDLTGQATCNPNPCGARGFCSAVPNQIGVSITCMWPL